MKNIILLTEQDGTVHPFTSWMKLCEFKSWNYSRLRTSTTRRGLDEFQFDGCKIEKKKCNPEKVN